MSELRWMTAGDRFGAVARGLIALISLGAMMAGVGGCQTGAGPAYGTATVAAVQQWMISKAAEGKRAEAAEADVDRLELPVDPEQRTPSPVVALTGDPSAPADDASPRMFDWRPPTREEYFAELDDASSPAEVDATNADRLPEPGPADTLTPATTPAPLPVSTIAETAIEDRRSPITDDDEVDLEESLPEVRVITAPLRSTPAQPQITTEVCFSDGSDLPGQEASFVGGGRVRQGGCLQRVIQLIDEATDVIRVQAYAFTSPATANAILEATLRGVESEIIIDGSAFPRDFGEMDFLHAQGVTVLIDDRHSAAHSNVVMIDGRTVVTGSSAFTPAADRTNAENLLIVRGDRNLYREYLNNYLEHRDHSGEYRGRSVPIGPPLSSNVTRPRQRSTTQSLPIKIVYVGRPGDTYHRADCSSLPRNQIPVPLSDARLRYTPCAECKPPR